MENNVSIRKALILIASSIALTLLIVYCSFSLYGKWRYKKRSSEAYQITALVQTGPEKEALKTTYLAELLDLSVNAPKNLYALNLKKAEAALLTSPLISKAHVTRLPPNTLYIDYEVRKPVARLSDYQNTAINAEGYLFPIAPFLTPKEIPEIYLGLPPFGAPADSFGRAGGEWRTPLQNTYLQLAFDILHTFEDSPWKEGLRIKRIDVSNASAPTLGRREIVLFTEEEITLGDAIFTFPKILRLAPKDWNQQLQNFFSLRRSMIEDYKKQLANQDNKGSRFAPRIVDLRVPQLAFVETD